MKIALVGAGRVGLVSGLVFFELGHEVTLLDVDRARVEQLRRGEMPFFEAGATESLRAATGSERWSITEHAEDITACDAVSITVPTPTGPGGAYNLAALRAVVAMLRRVRAAAGDGVRWRGIFLRSTVLPGTTQEVLSAALASEAAGNVAPCPVGYLPEFLREGTALADARRPDRIVVGAEDPALYALAREMFAGLDTEFFETGTRTAELVKTANNAMLSVCISFANEIARLVERVDGADAMEVFAGLHLDRRFHGTFRAGIADYFVPGPGFGGSCLGKDLAALVAFAGERGEEARLLSAALRINETQPARFVARIEAALGGLAGRRVLVLGLAFKPGTDDVRDSIALPIVRELAARGAAVRAHDPRVVESGCLELLRSLGVDVLPDDAVDDAVGAAFDDAEAVALVTAWPRYLEALPGKLAKRTRPLLFADARGILRRTRLAPCVTYLGIGVSAGSK